MICFVAEISLAACSHAVHVTCHIQVQHAGSSSAMNHSTMNLPYERRRYDPDAQRWDNRRSHVSHRQCWHHKRDLAILQNSAVYGGNWFFQLPLFGPMPWIGSSRARQIALTSVKPLLRHWRTQGTPVPFHCGHIANCCFPNTCQHLRLRVQAGNFHAATLQSLMPWPHALQHLATPPASITLPPTRTQILASLRDNLRSLQRRCRIKSYDMALEDIAASVGY